ncbi:MAG TPA: glycoside hydrolase family 25 protein [Tepidisphaeraceae bacterium]|nr:glycoside hydrolase family 25 protein [Tepidisphaeraceae bacterium]
MTRGPSYVITCFLVAFVFLPATRVQAERALGVDVSQWQLDMNWETAYDQGIRFAFVRSSRGGTTPGTGKIIDERFYENMQEIDALAAQGKKLYAGAYHFGRWDTIGPVVNSATITAHARDQAQHFYDIAGAYMTPGYLRPVLDLEQDSNPDRSTPPLSKAQLSLWVNTMMDHVETLSGVEPLIYTNTNFATEKVDASVNHRDLWIARWSNPADPLTDNPETTVPYPNPYGVWNDPIGSTVASHDVWSFWQYTVAWGQGATYGAGSDAIDLDVANGDLNFVRSFLVPEPVTAPLVAGLVLLLSRRRRRV